MADLFISYSRDDDPYVRRLTATLGGMGRDVWVDLEDLYAGEEYWPEICAAIEGADAFAFVISPHSLASVYCGRELEHALAHNKRILPLMLAEVPETELPASLAARQWIFCREATDYDAGVRDLVAAIDTDPEWVREHSRLLVRARAWDAGGRDGSLLLRGRDLEGAESWLAEASAHPEPQPTPLQSDYVVSSRKAATRRQRMLLGAVTTGLVVALALAGVAWIQRQEAVRQRDIAFSRELAMSATSRLSADPELGVLLAAESVGVRRTPEADYALRRSLGAWLETGVRSVLRGHEGGLTDAAFSPDGRRIVTAGGDGTARVWEAATGAETAVLRGHEGGLARAVFSPDGGRVATAGEDGTARVWDAATGEPLAVVSGHEGAVLKVAFSSDGSRLVTAGMDGTARLWDAATGEPGLELRGHEELVSSATFGGGDGWVLTASRDKTARLWLARTGEAVLVLPTAGWVMDAKFSPDNELALTSGFAGAYLWSPSGGVALTPSSNTVDTLGLLKDFWQQAVPFVLDANFSPDGGHVVTTFSDYSALVWEVPELGEFGDLEVGNLTQVLRGHTDQLVSASFSPDGHWILTAGQDASARVWDWRAGKTVAELRGHGDAITRAAFSPDGRWVLTASADGTARVWEALTSTGVRELAGSTSLRPSFGPDGRTLVTEGEGDSLAVWDPASGEPVVEIAGHDESVNAATFSPDGAWIATASDDRTVRIWDTATGALARELRGHGDAVLSVAFSPDGTRIATSSGRPGRLVGSEGDDTARLWDAASGEELAALAGHQDAVLRAVFSPDGLRLATGSADHSARIWDLGSATSLATLEGHAGPVMSLAFSPDGRLLLTAGEDDSPKLWAAADGHLVAELAGHAGKAGKAVFSPDGTRIATASADHTARLWDAATGQSVAVFKGHREVVTDLAFSPDGRLLATSSLDGTVRLWDAASEQPVAAVRLVYPALSVSFGSGGEWLSVLSGFQVYLYACEVCGDLDGVLAAAGRRVSRRLTADEHLRHLRRPPPDAAQP